MHKPESERALLAVINAWEKGGPGAVNLIRFNKRALLEFAVKATGQTALLDLREVVEKRTSLKGVEKRLREALRSRKAKTAKKR